MTHEQRLGDTWPGAPSTRQMMDDLWNAIHDEEHGHPASPETPAQCWQAMLDHVRQIRQDRWDLWHETGRLETTDA